MAKQIINIGSVADDGTGNTLRDGGDITNDNFNEIYSKLGDGTTLYSLTFPNATDTIVARDTSDTLTNKTIDASNNTISNITNSMLSGSAGISNANLANSSFTLVDESSTSSTISLGESLKITGGSGITTVVSGDTLSVNLDSNVVTETSIDILTNKTLDAAVIATSLDMNGTELILDADADTSITSDTDDQIDIKFGGNDRITLTSGEIDLKNDGTVSGIKLYCEVGNAHYARLQSGPHSGYSGNATITLPTTTDTLVGRATTDTLTNKTIDVDNYCWSLNARYK